MALVLSGIAQAIVVNALVRQSTWPLLALFRQAN